MKKLRVILMLCLGLLPGVALAASSTGNQAIIQTLKSRGDAEINRRLTSLNTLTSAINATTKLSSSDQSALASEVSTEISGLTALKTKLDGDTDITVVRADIQSIFADYRVYALILPKVRILIAADRLSIADTTLTNLATKIAAQITADQAAGKNVASLSTQLTQMQASIASATSIYSNVHDSTINLQPSDYNTDHTVLAGKRTQLGQAATDLKNAVATGKSLIASLKSL